MSDDYYWKHYFYNWPNTDRNPYGYTPKDYTRKSLLSQIADINRLLAQLFSNTLSKSHIIEEKVSREDDRLQLDLTVERQGRKYRVTVEEIPEVEPEDDDNSSGNTDYFTD